MATSARLINTIVTFFKFIQIHLTESTLHALVDFCLFRCRICLRHNAKNSNKEAFRDHVNNQKCKLITGIIVCNPE